MTKTVRCLAGLALMLCGCFASAVSAQTAPVAVAEPPPVADRGTTGQSNCIAEDDNFERRGQQPVFVIALENKCEQRLKCRVFVYITSAKGATQSRGTLVLAPKSQGAAAKKSHVVKVKMTGGSSQSARECRVF